jgi:nucleoid DNA-binding protein
LRHTILQDALVIGNKCEDKSEFNGYTPHSPSSIRWPGRPGTRFERGGAAQKAVISRFFTDNSPIESCIFRPVVFQSSLHARLAHARWDGQNHCFTPLQGGFHTMGNGTAKKAPTKTEVFNAISEATELSKKDVAAVFDALTNEIGKALGKKGPGAFTIPGLCKIVVKDVPAKPRREVRNPATGQMIWAEAKPASKSVRVRALKSLKEMAK